MSVNIVLGIGGTGSKVVEAMLHLSATGIGPSAMNVGFIDQDKTNGNVARTIELLDLLIEAHGSWRGEGSQHRLAPATVAPLFRTKVEPVHAGDNLWVPDPKGRTTLAEIFGPLAGDRQLFDTLFSDEEQKLPLDGGYRGKPHIGSAAMTAHSHEDRGFWSSLIEKVRQAKGGQQVRLLLAGSAFGGTGAAGFPTVARIVRDRLKAAKIESSVVIGGVLMLPYFTFSDPPEAEGDEEAPGVAIASDLLIQSRGALRHYQWQLEQYRLLEKSELFDELYFVGWNTPFRLDYHRPDAGDQKNPALLPELVAATAGYRFLNSGRNLEAERGSPLLISARNDASAIEWFDLPPHRDDAVDELSRRIAQFLRFSVGLLEWQRHFAGKDERRGSRGDPWYRRQGLGEIDWKDAPPSAELRVLNALVARFLEWAGAIQAYARRDPDFRFGLWNLDGLVSEPRFDDPARLLEAFPAPADDYASVFGRVAVRDAHGSDPVGSAVLADWLSNAVASPETRGLGTLVSSLYKFSDPRVQRLGE